ncbi:MATE family efflux transporter [Duncaniella muris]|jgi:MATE family multidrug resistance protein|uniref:MATE family efflux transporter n=1 Tax=Duncaniella muris TaxID=2094150 RepID=UPI0025A64455|nr:MATE family efflux transporter [Duncaniella muris]
MKASTLTGKAGFWKAYKPEYKSLWRLGMPVLVTQVGIIVVSFADTMMVGAYGTEELAAAAFVNSLFMIAIVMQLGFASGMTPIIGALYSRRQHDRVGATLRAGLQINSIVSIGFTAIMGTLYFFLDRFGQPEELMPLIRQYYLIILATLLPMAIFNCCQQTANGTTDTATPMWMILGANIINIIGNYLLIGGRFGCPELGLAGAGISTLTARCMATVGILTAFLTSKRYRVYRNGLRTPSSETAAIRRHVWLTSYPVMIQSGVECFLWSFGAIVSGWFGKIQLASYQVVNTISQLGFMTYMSFGIATSIRVANYTGLRDTNGIRRITSAGLHLNLLLSTIASAIFLIGGSDLIRIFTPDPEVTAAALLLIAPLILYQYGDAIQLTYANALRGTSNVKPLLWISLTSYIVIGIPFLLLLAKGLSMKNVGVYYSFSLALIVASVLLYRSFRSTIAKKELETLQTVAAGNSETD